MFNLTRHVLAVPGFGLMLGLASLAAEAQSLWSDTIPGLQVGCVHGEGSIEQADIGGRLRIMAKAAGATEVGIPFIDGVTSVPSKSWGACAVFKGPAHPTSNFEIRTLKESAGEFCASSDTDVSICSMKLVTLLRTKFPGLDFPQRVLFLFDYSDDKLPDLKASLARLITRTWPLSTDLPPQALPKPNSELDKQLLGLSMEPRSLLSTPYPPRVPNPAAGGNQTYSGVLVFVPLTVSQKTKLEAP
jgi:hypothetical protein